MITDEIPSPVNRDRRIVLRYRACSILRYIPSFRTRSILTPLYTLLNTLKRNEYFNTVIYRSFRGTIADKDEIYCRQLHR